MAISEQLSKEIGYIAGAIGGLTIIVTTIVRVRKWFLENKEKVDKLLALPAALEAQQKTIDDIKKQVMPDGGKPFADMMFDRFSEIEGMQGVMRAHLEIPVFEADRECNFTYASPALCQMFGMSVDDVMFKGWTMAIEDDDQRETIIRDWKKVAEVGKNYRTTVTIINQNNQKKYRLTMIITFVRDQAHQVIKFIGYVQAKEEIIQRRTRRKAETENLGGES